MGLLSSRGAVGFVGNEDVRRRKTRRGFEGEVERLSRRVRRISEDGRGRYSWRGRILDPAVGSMLSLLRRSRRHSPHRRTRQRCVLLFLANTFLPTPNPTPSFSSFPLHRTPHHRQNRRTILLLAHEPLRLVPNRSLQTPQLVPRSHLLEVLLLLSELHLDSVVSCSAFSFDLEEIFSGELRRRRAGWRIEEGEGEGEGRGLGGGGCWRVGSKGWVWRFGSGGGTTISEGEGSIVR